jgi:GGDEF domain-containing protein
MRKAHLATFFWLVLLAALSQASGHFLRTASGEELVLLERQQFSGGETVASRNYPAFSVSTEYHIPIIGTDRVTLRLFYQGNEVCALTISENDPLGVFPCPNAPAVSFAVEDKTRIQEGDAKVSAYLRVPHRTQEPPDHTLVDLELAPGQRKRFFFRLQGDAAPREYGLTYLGRTGSWQSGVQAQYEVVRVDREGAVVANMLVTGGLLQNTGPGAAPLLARGGKDPGGVFRLNGFFLQEGLPPDPRYPRALPEPSLAVEEIRLNGEPDAAGRGVEFPILDLAKNEFFRMDVVLKHPGVTVYEQYDRTVNVPNRVLGRVYVDAYLVKDDAFELFCVQNGGSDCKAAGRTLFEDPFVNVRSRGGELFPLIARKLLYEVWNLPPGAYTAAYPSYPRYWGSTPEVVNTQRVGFIGRHSMNDWRPGERRTLTFHFPYTDSSKGPEYAPVAPETSVRHLAPGRYRVYLLFRFETSGQIEQFGGHYYQKGWLEVPEVPLRVELMGITYGDKSGCAAAEEIVKPLASGGKPLRLQATASGVPGAAVIFTVRQAADEPRKEDDGVYSHPDVEFDARGTASFATGDKARATDPESGDAVEQALGEDAIDYYPGARRVEVLAESNMQGGVKARSAWTCARPLNIEFSAPDYAKRLARPEARSDRTLQQSYVDHAVAALEVELADSPVPAEERRRVVRALRQRLIDGFVEPVLADVVEAEAEAIGHQNEGWWKDAVFLNVFHPEFWNKFYSTVSGERSCLEELRRDLAAAGEDPKRSSLDELRSDSAGQRKSNRYCGNYAVEMIARAETARLSLEPRFDLTPEEHAPLLLDTAQKFLEDGAYDRANQFLQTYHDLRQATNCCAASDARAKELAERISLERKFYQWTSFFASAFVWVGCSFTPAAPVCGFLGAAGLGIMAWDLKTQWSQLSATQRTLMVGLVVLSTVIGVKTGVQKWPLYKARLVKLKNRGVGIVEAAWRALSKAQATTASNGWRNALREAVDSLRDRLSYARWLRWRARAGAAAPLATAEIAGKAEAVADRLASGGVREAAEAKALADALSALLRRLPSEEAQRLRSALLQRLRASTDATAQQVLRIVEARTGPRAVTQYLEAVEAGRPVSRELAEAAAEEARLLQQLGELDARFAHLAFEAGVPVKNAARMYHDLLAALRAREPFHYVLADVRHLGNVGLNCERLGLSSHIAEQAKDIVLEEQFKAIHRVLAEARVLERGGAFYRAGGDEVVLRLPGSMTTPEVEAVLQKLQQASRLTEVPKGIRELGVTQAQWERFIDIRKATRDAITPHTVFGLVPREQVEAALARGLKPEEALELLQYTGESVLKKAAGKALEDFDQFASRRAATGVESAAALSPRQIEARVRVSPPDYSALAKKFDAAIKRIEAGAADSRALDDLIDALDAYRQAAAREVKFAHPNFYSSVSVRSQLAHELREGGEVALVGVELNHLKDLNTLSYTAGDAALDAAAKALSESVSGIGFACRVQSKRFLVYLPKDKLPPGGIEKFARDLNAKVEAELAKALKPGEIAALKGAEAVSFANALDSATFGMGGVAANTRAQALVNELSNALEAAKARARRAALVEPEDLADALQNGNHQKVPTGGNPFDEVFEPLDNALSPR